MSQVLKDGWELGIWKDIREQGTGMQGEDSQCKGLKAFKESVLSVLEEMLFEGRWSQSKEFEFYPFSKGNH